LHAAFGSDGKSLQVGLAAAAGLNAARLAAAGASTSDEVEAGFAQAYGARWALEGRRAVEGNWIKAFPCCLQTHGAIEAAARVRAALGSPERPMSAEALAGKVHALAGDALDGVLDDPDRPAATLLGAAGLEAAVSS